MAYSSYIGISVGLTLGIAAFLFNDRYECTLTSLAVLMMLATKKLKSCVLLSGCEENSWIYVRFLSAKAYFFVKLSCYPVGIARMLAWSVDALN